MTHSDCKRQSGGTHEMAPLCKYAIGCLFLLGLLLRLSLARGEAQARQLQPVDPELLTSEGTKVVRFAVAQVDEKPTSTGYLYISRDRVRYEINQPAQLRGQGFDYARSDITQAQTSVTGLSAIVKADFRFRDGHQWRFLHIRRSALAGGTKIHESDRLSAQDLTDAVTRFDSVLAQAQALSSPGDPSSTMAPDRPIAVTVNLKIQAQPPSVDVYVDEKFRGRTSQQLGTLVVTDLAPGEHRVRLSLKGFKDIIRSVLLSPGDTGKVEAKLATSGLKPLSESEIQSLLASGVPKARILALVAKYGVDFELTPEIERTLRSNGADGLILTEIGKNKK
jgi:hypothetical protein